MRFLVKRSLRNALGLDKSRRVPLPLLQVYACYITLSVTDTTCARYGNMCSDFVLDASFDGESRGDILAHSAVLRLFWAVLT